MSLLNTSWKTVPAAKTNEHVLRLQTDRNETEISPRTSSPVEIG